jgi:LysR family transcriptional activator of nhaA
MEEHQLNYHHLRYFWEVARHGSLRMAADRMHVSQPTISAQIKALEESLGMQLFNRSGRGLKLTDSGRTVMDYASEIFGLGNRMLQGLHGLTGGRQLRLNLGITDSFAKLFAWNLVRPALREHTGLKVFCAEGRTPDLLAQLVIGRLDLVLADEPAPPSLPLKAFNHHLGRTMAVFCAAKQVAERVQGEFPACLNGAPMLLPAPQTAWRHELDLWLEQNHLQPEVVAEFDDSALMKTAAADGLGLVPIAQPVAHEASQRFGLFPVSKPVPCGFATYLITVERSINHPAVKTIAREAIELFQRSQELQPATLFAGKVAITEPDLQPAG